MRNRNAPVFYIVPRTTDRATVETLAQLSAEALSSADIIGLAYVAIHRGGKFTADVVGEAKRRPGLTLLGVENLRDYIVGKVSA